MSETFIKGTVRLAFEPGTTEALTTVSGPAAKVWKNSGGKFEVTFLKKTGTGAAQLYNVANIPDPRLTIYKQSDGSVLIGPKAPSSLFPGLTEDQYNAGGFHFRFEFSAAEANVAGITGTHYFKLTGYTSDDATDPDIFGRGLIEFLADGSAEGSAPVLGASYPATYPELVASLTSEMRKQAWLAMKAGIPDNLTTPSKRRILDVSGEGDPIDDIINP
jgi:hypothetical protein